MLRGRNHGSYWSLIMVNIKNAKVIDFRYIGVQVHIGVHIYACRGVQVHVYKCMGVQVYRCTKV